MEPAGPPARSSRSERLVVMRLAIEEVARAPSPALKAANLFRRCRLYILNMNRAIAHSSGHIHMLAEMIF